MKLTDFPANETKKWHPVYNNGVPYHILSSAQKKELRGEYPTLDDLANFMWARDADRMPQMDFCI
jgi:hypothetical protein